MLEPRATRVRVHRQLSAEQPVHWRDGHCDVLGWRPQLVATDMAAARVDEALAGVKDLRRAVRIVELIERQLACYHGNEDGPRVRMPSCGRWRAIGIRTIVVRLDYDIHVRLGLGLEIDRRGMVRL